MNFKDYQKLAFRTVSMLDKDEDNLNHMIMGIITEVGELVDIFKKELAYGKPMDIVNVGEEVGDIMFYLSGLAEFIELDLETIANKYWRKTVPYHGLVSPSNQRNQLFSLTEKIPTIIYKNEEDNIYSLGSFLNALSTFVLLSGLNIESVLRTNIEKLEKRYSKNRFDKTHALDRNLNAERNILEKGLS
jgi:NTP pyrophosphatase (non-canonical NTP hydrolase)